MELSNGASHSITTTQEKPNPSKPGESVAGLRSSQHLRSLGKLLNCADIAQQNSHRRGVEHTRIASDGPTILIHGGVILLADALPGK